MRILALDVGGTKTAAAVFEDNEKVWSDEIKSSAITDFCNTVQSFIDKSGHDVEGISIGAAGNVEGNEVMLTNVSVKINADELKEKFGVDVKLMNDLEAAGYALDDVEKEEIKEGEHAIGGKAVLAAGTGLGASFVVDNKVYPSEIGHVDAAALDDVERGILNYIQDKVELTNIEIEELVSGRGIVHIVEGLWKLKRLEVNDLLRKFKEGTIREKSILVFDNPDDPNFKKALEVFVRFYARAAKTLCLAVKPMGGLYIAGGIASRRPDMFNRFGFKIEFLLSMRMKELLQKIPVYVVTDRDLVLKGCVGAFKTTS